MKPIHRQLVSKVAICIVVVLALLPASGFAQQPSKSDHTDHKSSDAPLAQQLIQLREKVAQLEAMLKQQHSGQSSNAMQDMGDKKGMGMGDMKGMGKGGGMKDMTKMKGSTDSADMDMSGADSSGSSGMKPMGMGGMGGGMGMKDKGMGMGMKKDGGMGMMGMGMMGRMKGQSQTQMQMAAALPGFPGASHLYHIGATSFFLDHSEHITLTPEQQTMLNKIKEATLLAQNSLDRKIEESEQQLWVLTSADSPDATAIEGRIGEIAKLTAEKRIGFIRAVGKAAGVLTVEQRQTLIGYLPAEHTAADSQTHSTKEATK